MLRDSYAKTPVREDETLPTTHIRFTAVMYGLTFLYQAQEFHKMMRAKATKREDSFLNASSVEKPEDVETVCRPPDKSLSTCRVADFISENLAVGNNPFNFQMQALWVSQCAPW